MPVTPSDLKGLRRRLDEILSLHTGQPLDKVAADTERDYILGSGEARDYGLVDDVVSPRRGARSPGAQTASSGARNLPV